MIHTSPFFYELLLEVLAVEDDEEVSSAVELDDEDVGFSVDELELRELEVSLASELLDELELELSKSASAPVAGPRSQTCQAFREPW